MTAERWTESDFERMSWHDNHVHAVRIQEGEHGAGELWLDLDYILEWLEQDHGFKYRIVPACLKFLQVTSLRMSINYAAASAAMGPFSIASIERTEVPREHYVACVWRIPINWPSGEIEFEASGFEQLSRGEAVLTQAQALTARERGDA